MPFGKPVIDFGQQFTGFRAFALRSPQTGEAVGSPYIAQDIVGAGPDELVIIVEGSSARVAAWDIR